MGEAGRLGGEEFARAHPEAARELEASRRLGEASRDFRYPGGETGGEAAARAEAFIADLSGDRASMGAGDRVLLVCHGGLIRALVARLLGMEERRRFRLMPGNCGVTRLELPAREAGAAEGPNLLDRARLLSFNEEGHLRGMTSF